MSYTDEDYAFALEHFKSGGGIPQCHAEDIAQQEQRRENARTVRRYVERQMTLGADALIERINREAKL